MYFLRVYNFTGRKKKLQSTINYTCRLDKILRKQSDALFKELGMSLNTAINIFLRKAVSIGGFPFDVTLSTNSEMKNDSLAKTL